MTNSYSDSIELHYFIDGDVHEMNALAVNRCAYQVLQIIQTLAKQWEEEVEVFAFPHTEGGLKEWLKIVKRNEDKDAPITTAVIKWAVIGILGSPFFFINKCIDTAKGDTLLLDSQKKDYVAYFENHRDISSIENQCAKLRSNFYEALSMTNNVSGVVLSSHQLSAPTYSKEVKRTGFPDFILSDNELDPIDIDNAVILITAPVISKGKYNTWHGKYNDDYINFKMLSNEFKTLVQTGEVVFRNGFSINCALRIHRRLTDTGAEQVSKYEVLRVNSYFIADEIIETKEGRVHRQKKDIENAPNLFTGFEEDI